MTAFSREVLIDRIQTRLLEIGGVRSVTLVGSFADRGGLDEISDIDVVVIVESLTESLFRQCQDAMSSLDAASFGLPGRPVRINSTFGPVKYDHDGSLVIHLMVYDRAGHRRHVIKSPFTCYDWERSVICRGPSLASIYPVLRLQPGDLLTARRGIQDYLRDLAGGVIRIRRYGFHDDQAQEITADTALDARHQGEYAFHIVRYLLANSRKLLRQENRLYDPKELLETARTILPDATPADHLLQNLWAAKTQGRFRHGEPGDTVRSVAHFVEQYQQAFVRHWQDALQIVFVRHAPTPLNDGRFLGRRDDPDILPAEVPDEMRQTPFDRVYCSPSRRTAATARLIAPHARLVFDARLQEIDYGRADGLHRKDLDRDFPMIPEAWARGEDPRFPGGECTEDVWRRLTSFLEELPLHAGRVLIVTHNVVLRCLAGTLLGIPPIHWHRLPVPHMAPMHAQRLNGRIYADFSADVKSRITDSLGCAS